MIFWKDWQLPTPPQTQNPMFLIWRDW
jgi:hypothetical protein